MKKFCIIFLTTIIIILSAVGVAGRETTEQKGEFLRIHIRANSNLEIDQSVKYEVRDNVVEFLTPVVAESVDREDAEEKLCLHLSKIEAVAKETLRKAGFAYGATAKVVTENFPTRVYGEYTLPAGEYRALVLSLGEGKGDNWWCVVYPPLCFTSATNPVYKSKIVELIKRWQAGTS
ncbi:MAG: stage II sporulation protein R [Clostridia bacterium]|nr:stage II sporulation protein R [Clostridia bacterium]